MEEMTHEVVVAVARAEQAGTIGRSLAKWLVAASALMAGALVIFAIGFAPNAFLHGAAHDVRHTSGFPCH